MNFLVFITLLGMGLIAVGNGLFNTLISVRMKLMGIPDLQIGMITSFYYVGMLASAFKTADIVIKVGHIRAYILFTAILAVATFAPGLYVNEPFWIVARVIAGYSLGAIYIIVESWLLHLSNAKNRGKYLSLYIIVLYGAQSAGQLFLKIIDVQSILLFCIACIFTVFAILPIIVFPSIKSPNIDKPTPTPFRAIYKIAPIAVIACFVSGVLIASVYGLLPAYVQEQPAQLSSVAVVVALSIGGGMAMQYPFGYLSDKFDKKKVLCLLSCIGATCSLLIIFFARTNFQNLLVFNTLIFLSGGAIFALYPVSLSYLCDAIRKNQMVQATESMMLSYGVGSIVGPLLIGECMYVCGAKGSFMGTSIVLALLIVFILYQSNIRKSYASN